MIELRYTITRTRLTGRRLRVEITALKAEYRSFLLCVEVGVQSLRGETPEHLPMVAGMLRPWVVESSNIDGFLEAVRQAREFTWERHIDQNTPDAKEPSIICIVTLAASPK
jgi:hypothetical protein